MSDQPQVVISVEQQPDPPARLDEGMALVGAMAFAFLGTIVAIVAIVALAREIRRRRPTGSPR